MSRILGSSEHRPFDAVFMSDSRIRNYQFWYLSYLRNLSRTYCQDVAAPYTFLWDIDSETVVHLILATLVTPWRCPLQQRVPLQVSQPMPIIVGIVVIRVQQAHLYCFLSPLDLALFSPTYGMIKQNSRTIDNSYLTVLPKGSSLVLSIAFDTTSEIGSYATKRQASL